MGMGMRMARGTGLIFVGVGVMVGLCACSPGEPKFSPGTSDGPLPVNGPSSRADEEAKRWEHFERVHELEILVGTFRSRGHGTGTWDGELRGSLGASEALRGLVGRTDRMPKGTVLVQSHRQHGGNEVGMFVMEKRQEGYFPGGGDWEYAVIGRDGRIEARGKLESCARCHAEAEVDFVFARVPTSE